MKLNKKWLDQASQLCGEIRPEDGVDPRLLSKKTRRNKSDRKCLQLCKRVERILSLTLGGEIVESSLHELVISQVELTTGGRQLNVTLTPAVPITDQQYDDINAALARACGYLRSVIAQSINRKRVPMLTFHLVSRKDTQRA